MGFRDRNVNVRLTEAELRKLRAKTKASGFETPSDLIRRWIAASEASVPPQAVPEEIYDRPRLYHRAGQGRIFHGDSRGLLNTVLKEQSVDLVVTSPPFALRRKKAYGNEPAHEYLEWFRAFARGIKRVLKSDGSLVIDIGPAWLEGIPAKSLYQFELLVMLCEEFGFYLAQDFYWWNPSRMPAPAEWVNVRRLRAKDAVTPVWWLSPTPWPKASNRRVLSQYTKSQETLFRRGYNAGPRPSGHVVSGAWGKNNGGAIPPNLVAAPNTASEDPYQIYCRANNLQTHPARFPWGLPEFFVRMLTNKGDLVLDPFAGSCMTGAVAEELGRRWVCCELREDYLEGALSRFTSGSKAMQKPVLAKDGYRVPVPKPFEPEDETIDGYGGKPPRRR